MSVIIGNQPWLTGKYDMVLLEDYPYVDLEKYKAGETACPSVDVTVGVSNQFYEEEPEFCEFLEKYETSSALTSEALAYMQDNEGVTYTDTAKWFLTEHSELIDQWLPEDKAEDVRGALGLSQEKTNYFFDFPFVIPIDVNAFDTSVKAFANQSTVFKAIRDGLNILINVLNAILNLIPWWLLIAIVFFGGYKLSGKVRNGIIYSILLFLVGAIGLWDLMYETLSIVLASVVISLLIGLPVGIMISGSDRANVIVRPILDTMQTMPVFVYLIPAVLFFGLGKAPAVIAHDYLCHCACNQADQPWYQAGGSGSGGSCQILWLHKVAVSFQSSDTTGPADNPDRRQPDAYDGDGHGSYLFHDWRLRTGNGSAYQR